MILTLAISAGLVGALLLTLGLRGRRTDDHPLCRRCGFDLLGTYPAHQTCPECGAALGGGRAIRMGHRRRIAVPLAAGVVLLLVGAVAGGSLAWGRATSFNWNTIKPVWLLVQESSSADPATAGPAVGELARRLAEGGLSPERGSELVERALALQGDPNGPWVVEWAALIEAADSTGLLSDEQIARYLRQSVHAWLATRTRTRQGDMWSIGIGLSTARLDPGREFWSSPQLLELTVGGRDVPHGWTGGGYNGMSMNGRSTSSRGVTLDAEPGVHEVSTLWRVHLTRDMANMEDLFTHFDVELSGQVEVVPPGQPLVRIIKDESLREHLQKNIRLDRTTATIADGKARVMGSITLDDLPASVAFDIFWRVDEREWKVGTIASRASNSMGTFYEATLDGFDADRVTVILRPSIEAAERSLDVKEIWDGELVVPDVPVKRSGSGSPE